jgi:hypothetical protein
VHDDGVTSTAEHYLRDLGDELWRLMAEAATRPPDDFERGRLTGLYEAVSLMLDQAVAFGLSPAEVGLADRDPARWLGSP